MHPLPRPQGQQEIQLPTPEWSDNVPMFYRSIYRLLAAVQLTQCNNINIIIISKGKFQRKAYKNFFLPLYSLPHDVWYDGLTGGRRPLDQVSNDN